MTWQIPILLGVAAGSALTLMISPLLPSSLRLGSALDRLRPPTPPVADETGEASTGWQSRVEIAFGEWGQRHLPRVPIITPDPKQLAITGTDLARFTGQRLFGAAVGLLMLPVMAAIQVRTGAGVSGGTVMASLLLAVLGFGVPTLVLRQKAKAAQLAMARAAVAYMQISAIARAGGAGIMDTVTDAADAFDTPAYLHIRDVLERARWSGEPAWRALQADGERIGVQELTEVGDLLRLASSTETGAHIYQTLRARARSLRQSLLAREVQRERGRTLFITVAGGGVGAALVAGALFPFAVQLMQAPTP